MKIMASNTLGDTNLEQILIIGMNHKYLKNLKDNNLLETCSLRAALNVNRPKDLS